VPLYVYKNLATGETFEIEQSMADDALTAHPETGDPVKRIIQPVGIAFKGSGFYVNDSRKGSAPAKKSDAGASKTDGKASKSSKSSD
jgi:putative FmdB family regulatory protein